MCLSGSFYNYWAMSEENNHLKLAYKIAEDLGEPATSFEDLVKVLHSVPAKQLNVYSSVNSTRGRLEITFTPVVESIEIYICSISKFETK